MYRIMEEWTEEEEHENWRYQDVQTGWFEEGDLVSDGKRGEARQAFGKLHNLDDALCGELTKLVPQPQVQLDSMVGAWVL